uniref:Uncharacterized protein n=1 Tax=Arundo donax TaxID=35708 RepID=A0A0A9ENY3_ARUDO
MAAPAGPPSRSASTTFRRTASSTAPISENASG